MTFDVHLSADAQRDFYRAQTYYDVEAPEQTERFIGDFFATSRRLSDFPYSAPVVHGSARRVSLRVFPYQLWYRVLDAISTVQIIAVLHHRQDPAQLKQQLHETD